MNRLFFLLAAGILGSCTLSKVDRYPGKPLVSFPQEIQGEYKAKASGIRGLLYSKQLDSLRLRIVGKNIDMLGEKGWETNFSIGKEQVLSELRPYYFISTKDPQEPAYWNTALLYNDGRELIFFPLTPHLGDLSKDPLKNYLPMMMLTRSQGKKNIRNLNADSSWAKVPPIHEDSKDSILYYQMDDEQVIRYIKNEMNVKNSFRFVRVKQAMK